MGKEILIKVWGGGLSLNLRTEVIFGPTLEQTFKHMNAKSIWDTINDTSISN